jgi:lipid II:glycine glycyltransferase (peptidoglycan interpeptide bridge formation enzyme)
MLIREVYADEKEKFNQVVTHPLQSWEWGEFREKTSLKVIRIGQYDKDILTKGLLLTIHPLPKTDFNIAYLPKSIMLNDKLLEAVKKVGQDNNCLFVKIEPNVQNGKQFFLDKGCVYGRPLFTKYTFQIDLTKDEPSLLNSFKSKTRYNIGLAERKGVKVEEDNSLKTFEQYLKLTFETTKRQKFYAHDIDYHKKMWQTLHASGIARLLKASYKNEVLATWILFVFNNVLYYPYGASLRKYKNAMASNLIMWEAIKFGKKLNCHTFDLWGSLGPEPDPKDPWYGFHKFKEGYNPKLIEFIGTFDLIINPKWYPLYTLADSLRWKYLKLKALLPF